ncbi:MAG: hypothetical protein QOJ64_1882 [Acidobacteriota bacterium]|jgi:hypothetical protein|nr:hypothetical protein [Acidobacteriota bacterium]
MMKKTLVYVTRILLLLGSAIVLHTSKARAMDGMALIQLRNEGDVEITAS